MAASSLVENLPPTAEGAAVAKTSGRGLREMFPGWDFDTKLPSPWDSSGNWVGVTLSPVVPGTETEVFCDPLALPWRTPLSAPPHNPDLM